MIAAGGNAIVSRKMGAGEKQEAKEDFTLLIITGAVIGFLILIIGTIWIDKIIYALGVSDLLFTLLQKLSLDAASIHSGKCFAKAVDAIYFDDHDIYVDGAVVAQVPSFYVSAAQCDEYRVSVQLLVKERLSHPDNAQFGNASQWAFGVNEDGYDVIQSSVTAQNAMGVESTEKFQVLIDRSTGAPVSLNIGGTEYIQ